MSSFLQRMGRTGRREGAVANTSFFVENMEAGLQAIALIELAKSGWVESLPVLRRCWPVMVHQLLAMTLESGVITADSAWRHLSQIKDLSGISRAEFDELILLMLHENFLYETGGQLAMGDKTEKVYGRKNFMELYAVFSSPVRYNVLTVQKQDIGTLEQNFVDGLVDNATAFLLGGRAWVSEHVNHSDRTVRVSPAPGGKRPSWGGFIPQQLSFELCQRIREILMADTRYPYINGPLAVALDDRRAELGESLRHSPSAIVFEDGQAHAWTFASGRINRTLRYVFEHVGGFKVTSDNFQIKMEGDKLTHEAIFKIIDQMRSPSFWADQGIWGPVAGALPEYRLSKFQRALPAHFSDEMVVEYLLDLDGAQKLVARLDS